MIFNNTSILLLLSLTCSHLFSMETSLLQEPQSLPVMSSYSKLLPGSTINYVCTDVSGNSLSTPIISINKLIPSEVYRAIKKNHYQAVRYYLQLPDIYDHHATILKYITKLSPKLIKQPNEALKLFNTFSQIINTLKKNAAIGNNYYHNLPLNIYDITEKGYHDLLRMILLNFEIGINAPINDSGDSLLHIAVRNNYIDITRLLLAHRADKSHKNGEGISPYDLVKSKLKTAKQALKRYNNNLKTRVASSEKIDYKKVFNRHNQLRAQISHTSHIAYFITTPQSFYS